MECVFGLAGNGFAFVVADTSAVDGILIHKYDEDKFTKLDSHKLIAASGERGDRVQFTEYVQKHVSLYQLRNGIPLTTAAAANFTRAELVAALRKNSYSVNILMAGYDKEAGASLYSIDFLGTLHKVDKGAFGYGSYVSLSTMDRHYRSDMSFAEAFTLVRDCIFEINARLGAPSKFVVKVVDKMGARFLYSSDYTRRTKAFFTKTLSSKSVETEKTLSSRFSPTKTLSSKKSVETEKTLSSRFSPTKTLSSKKSVETEKTAPSQII